LKRVDRYTAVCCPEGSRWRQRDLDFAHQVVEEMRGLIVDDRHQSDFVQHTPTRREQIAAFATGETALGVDPGVHDAEADGGVALPIPHRLGGHLEDAALAVAVLGGEAAGEQVDAPNRLDVDDAEQATDKIALVEGLVEFHAVENHQHFVRLPASNGELGRKIVGGDAGQPRHRAGDVLGEGHILELPATQRLTAYRPVTHDRVAARRDHDFTQADRLGGQLDSAGIGLFAGLQHTFWQRLVKVAQERQAQSARSGRQAA
jgi:hypothetical protein